MVETHESKEVPIHSNTTIVIRSKLPCQRGTSLVNNSRQQSKAHKAKPRTAWRVLCQVRVRIVYVQAIFLRSGWPLIRSNSPLSEALSSMDLIECQASKPPCALTARSKS